MSAAMINKFMGMLGLAEPIDEEDYIEEEAVEETVEARQPLKIGYFANRFTNREQYSEEKISRSAKVLPMTGASPVVTSSKMVITEPQCFDDVKEISEHLKDRRSVIVNLETVTKDDQRRIIDFLSGATYVIDGSMQKISSLIYLITPKNVEIQNDIEKAQYRSKLSFSWMK